MSHIETSAETDDRQTHSSDKCGEIVIVQPHPIQPKDLDAKRKPGGNRSSVVKKKVGKKGKGKSMGRYPFLTLANRYLETYGDGYAESTRNELERRFARMNEIFVALKESGKIESTNPEKLSADDILAYVNYLKKGKLKESGILHNLGPLNNLLAFAGNPAVNYCRKQAETAIREAQSIWNYAESDPGAKKSLKLILKN